MILQKQKKKKKKKIKEIFFVIQLFYKNKHKAKVPGIF